MESQLIHFVRNNADELLQLKRIEQEDIIVNWNAKRKNDRLLKRLLCFKQDTVLSPEDILINKETNRQIVEVIMRIKKAIGGKALELMIDRYCYKHTITDISKTHGRERKWASRIVNHGLRCAIKILTEMEANGEIDSDIFRTPTVYYEAHTPMIKLKYPVDMAMKTYDENYVYRGEVRCKTKCMVPEYLLKCFGDSSTICNMCQDKFGKTTCKRKDKNKGVCSN